MIVFELFVDLRHLNGLIMHISTCNEFVSWEILDDMTTR